MIEIKGRSPSNEDIDLFLERFFYPLSKGFLYEGMYIYTAGKIGEDGTPLYAVQGKSYADLIAETKPLIEARVLEVYSNIEDSVEASRWDTTPRSVEEFAILYAENAGTTETFESLPGVEKRNHAAFQKAVKHINGVTYRIKTYFETVLPFMLRHTMFHEIATVIYSTSKGDSAIVRHQEDSNFFKIESEKELQNYLNNKTLGKMPAGQHAGLRSIFWTPSVSGRNVKLGIVDIDNPAKLPEKELRKTVKRIHRILSNQGHPTIIMFTGASYQIWFGSQPNEPLGDIRELNEYLRGILSQEGAFNREEAIDLKIPFLDLATNKPRGSVRMFFSLHYPPAPKKKSEKEYTGLAAIPISPADLTKFDPTIDAHPEQVRANFIAYAGYISKFFDLLRIGQDYPDEEIESPPTCSRLDKLHSNNKLLSYLYDNEDIITVEYRNVEAKLADEDTVIAHSVARGLEAVLVYDPTGASTPPGMVTTRVVGGRARTTPAHTFYITKQGTVVYDDYICRDFERYCEAKRVRTARLSGHVVVASTLREETDRQAAISIITNKDGLNQQDCRKLRFVTSRVETLNGDTIPNELMKDQVMQFNSKRVHPAAYFELTGDIGEKIKQIFMDLIKTRKSGAILIYGEETYIVKSTRTINLAVLGMKKTKTFQSKESPPLYVGIAKRSSKYGLVYHMIGLAQIALPKAERIELRELVEGEEGRNVIPSPEAVIPASVDASLAEILVVTEPTVVVEVSYDDVSPELKLSYPHYFTDTGRYRKVIPSKHVVTPLINAKIIKIRSDLDIKREKDISIYQDQGIDILSKPPAGVSLLGALPNPPQIVEFVRRNSAFFGVPETLDTYVGGIYDEKKGSIVGGRKVQIPLVGDGPRYKGEKLPGELTKAFNRFHRGEEGFKIYVEPRSLVQSTDPKYFRIHNLGGEYQIAKDDQRGAGADGNLVTSINNEITKVNNFTDMLNTHKMSNGAQAREDTKVVGTMLESGYNSNWHDPDSEVETYRYEDQQYKDDYKALNKTLSKALSKTAIDTPTFNQLTEGVMENPQPIKAAAWGRRIDEYIEEYNKWEARPQPKESWDRYFMGLGASWEVPLLEKERLLREVNEAHGLTDSEIERIDMNYGEPLLEALSESILADLYEVPEDADESED
jgi:hypothetical protein